MLSNKLEMKRVIDNYAKKNNLTIERYEQVSEKGIKLGFVWFSGVTVEGKTIQIIKQGRNNNHRNINRYELYFDGKKVLKKDW